MVTHLADYSPWVHKEFDTVEWLTFMRASVFMYIWLGVLGGSVVKNLPAKQETWVHSPGQEDPLEMGMATHSSILAWRIPWTEEPGRLQSMGSQRVGHHGSFLALRHTHIGHQLCIRHHLDAFLLCLTCQQLSKEILETHYIAQIRKPILRVSSFKDASVTNNEAKIWGNIVFQIPLVELIGLSISSQINLIT